jgi:hypothetical protein
MTDSKAPTKTYYSMLGLTPSASVQQIRRAYRDRSKFYHPDTTELPPEVATSKFQQLNEAYATLSNPERRLAYDQKIGYSRISVMQAPAYLNQPVSRGRTVIPSSKAYLDPSDRPLSAGEIFALFLLGVTFAACLMLVIAIGLTQGETAFQLPPPPETQSAIVMPSSTPEPALEESAATTQAGVGPLMDRLPRFKPQPATEPEPEPAVDSTAAEPSSLPEPTSSPPSDAALPANPGSEDAWMGTPLTAPAIPSDS